VLTLGEAARETSGKERLDLPRWMDLDLASKMSITAVVSYWDHMYRQVEKWQIWIQLQ